MGINTYRSLEENWLGLSIGVGGKQYVARWATIAYYATDRVVSGYIDRYHVHQYHSKSWPAEYHENDKRV